MELLKIAYLENYRKEWPRIVLVPGNACFDLRAAISDPIAIYPNEPTLIPLGIIIEPPSNCCLEIYPRSGLSSKDGITLINTPGQIDPSYRGQIYAPIIYLKNTPYEPYIINPGDRIVQAKLVALRQTVLKEVDFSELSKTWRGDNGFGHSGTK